MKRGEGWWVESPEPLGRRPAVLVSRDEASQALEQAIKFALDLP